MKQSGIYKITNPNGQAYIGQSVDLKKRLMTYMGVKLVYSQPKIYESLKQHGSKSHQYDILERCDCAELDVKEAEYKQQFINEHGWGKALFCWLNDPPTSEERRARQKQNIIKTNKVKAPKWVAPRLEYDSVYQYDLDGNFIQEYDNDMIWALVDLPNGKHLRNQILICARGDINVAFGYQWKSKRCDSIGPYISNRRNAGVSKYKHLFD
jgi:hypothetical protein